MYDSSISNNTVLPIHQENTFEYPNDDHFLNFPAHLLDNDELFLSTFLSHQSPTPTPLPPLPPPPPLPPSTMDDNQNQGKRPAKEKRKQPANGPKRRTGKKDRHSKIYTAHGPRDRRMRLSLQIARKFFDLQDILGFDKASKTIEWLFNKSKAAIKDLTQRSCTTTLTPSSPSEETYGDGGVISLSGCGDNKKMGNKGGQRTKENRNEARARARKRTKEKLMMQKEVKHIEHLDMEHNPTGRRRRVNNMEYIIRADDQQNHPPLEDQMASVGIIEKFLGASSSSISHFPHGRNEDCSFTTAHLSDQMMRHNHVNFAASLGNWVTNNASMDAGHASGSNHISFVQGQDPYCAFLVRPYNQQGN